MDAAEGISQLADAVADPQTREKLAILLDQGVEGTFFSLDAELWLDVVHRVLFSTWTKSVDGWGVAGESVGFAAATDEAMHIALMIDSPVYPYGNEAKAQAVRKVCWETPEADGGLVSLMAGLWDPFPPFPPDQVLTTSGRGLYNAQAREAIADWTYRSANAVGKLQSQLTYKLQRLLRREVERLRPLDVPEAEDVLAFWLGKAPAPPSLAVMFSGLGREATEWVRLVGQLAQLIRDADEQRVGLTSLVTTARDAATLIG
jgi:hypothetical protein